MSDLHLEGHPGYRPRPAPQAELLVLAGDVGSYQRGSRLEDRDFGLARFSPAQGAWPVPVLFVPGNHEYDNLDFDETHARLRDTCERLGITWLEREEAVFGEIRFVGTTLWSDFDALALRPDRPEPTLQEVLKLRHKAFRAANFYLEKAAALRYGRPMLAEGWREQALVCQSWLRAALERPFSGTTVVVTHFAPSLRSHDPRYGVNPATAGFCNSLEDLMQRAQFWLHGHLHCQHDYVERGCRVVANTLGYASKGEQEGFRESFLLEITEAPAMVAGATCEGDPP